MEAFKVTADNADQVAAWCDGRVVHGSGGPEVEYEGPRDNQVGYASPGDIVVRGVFDLYFDVTPELYEHDYEEIKL